jgi:hypothetical protein
VGKYLGKTFTVLNSGVVAEIIHINEKNGYSETLKQDPDDEYGYLLRASWSIDGGFWVIDDSNIEELLEQKAITIS